MVSFFRTLSNSTVLCYVISVGQLLRKNVVWQPFHAYVRIKCQTFASVKKKIEKMKSNKGYCHNGNKKIWSAKIPLSNY